MSIVQRDLDGAAVLDLFAGSGALGLEALSRGARTADFVERDSAVIAILEKNIATLDTASAARIHRTDGLKFAHGLGRLAYDVAFADPPYASREALALAERWLEVPFARVLGIEHSSRDAMPGVSDRRKYGSSALSFYRLQVAPPTFHAT